MEKMPTYEQLLARVAALEVEDRRISDEGRRMADENRRMSDDIQRKSESIAYL